MANKQPQITADEIERAMLDISTRMHLQSKNIERTLALNSIKKKIEILSNDEIQSLATVLDSIIQKNALSPQKNGNEKKNNTDWQNIVQPKNYSKSKIDK